MRTALGTQATLLALGTLAIAAPAQAGTFTVDVAGDVRIEQVSLNPLLNFFAPTTASTINTSLTDLETSFEVSALELLDDPAQYADGDITLDATLVGSAFGDLLTTPISMFFGDWQPSPEVVVTTADTLFDITLTGKGTLTTAAGVQSAFDLNYDNAANALSVTGYDANAVSTCTVGDCAFSGQLALGLSVMVDEFIAFSDGLLDNPNFDLPPETQTLLQSANMALSSPFLAANDSFFLGKTQVSFQVATAVAPDKTVAIAPTLATASAATAPASVPEPGLLLGLTSAAGLALLRGRRLSPAQRTA